MPRVTRVAALVAALCLPSFPASAAGYFKSLSIPQRAQAKSYYCSASIVEMWIEWLHSKAMSQSTIASEQGITSSHGLNSNELADALEDYSSHWFNDYARSDTSTFASQMMKEIQSGEPVAVVGNTRNADGSVKRACGHWLLVDSFWNSSTSYSSSYSYLNGFYMNDPLYGASWSGASDYYAISPTSYINKSTFFSTVASKCTTKFYMVRD